MEKQNKVYRLAIHYTDYNKDPTNKSRLEVRLPKIIPQVDKQQCNNNQNSKKVINIFHKPQSGKKTFRKLDDIKPYAIVGKKQVKSYYAKMAKKKNPTRKSQSFIDYSVRSSTVRSRQQNSKKQHRQFITKDAILKDIRQKITNQPLNKRKIKDRLDHYIKQWNETTMNQKGFKSIYQQVNQHRKILQKKNLNSFHQNKNHIDCRLWEVNLRKQQSLKSLVNKNSIEKIQRKGLILKSKDKLQQEMDWVNKKEGFVFSRIDMPKQSKQIIETTFKQSSNFFADSVASTLLRS